MTTTYRKHTNSWVDKYEDGDKTTLTSFGAIGSKVTKGEYEWRPDTRATAQIMYHHPLEHPNFTTEFGPLISTHRRGAEPTELFKNKPGEITGAYADPTMRGHVGALLGMAVNHHQRLTGDNSLPFPDSSLSVHSSALVQKLRRRGVPVPVNPSNPGAVPTNLISMDPAAVGVGNVDMYFGPDDIPAHEVHAGKQKIRGILRASRPQHPVVTASPQFQQQRLF